MGVLIKTNGDREKRLPEKDTFTMKELQSIVGGYFEFVPLADGLLMVVNEEGLLKELPQNRQASAIAMQTIVGDVIIVHESEVR